MLFGIKYVWGYGNDEEEGKEKGVDEVELGENDGKEEEVAAEAPASVAVVD